MNPVPSAFVQARQRRREFIRQNREEARLDVEAFARKMRELGYYSPKTATIDVCHSVRAHLERIEQEERRPS